MATADHGSSGRRPAEERREQLLVAAVEVMSERGVAGATTRAVAERAGVPHGVFHYCFRSKDEFFTALLEREVARTLDTAGGAMRGASSVREALEAALTAQLDHVRSDPAYHLALAELSSALARGDVSASLARWEQGEYRARTRADLEAWSAGEDVTWDEPLERIAAHLVALGAGVAATWLADRDDVAARAAIEVAAGALERLSRRG